MGTIKNPAHGIIHLSEEQGAGIPILPKNNPGKL
jgi:hypothetical protein